ncbi:hypothetical protein AKJ57_05570 [candidate division MSBL1 archaeon SCGC-AAA259A05]|uniref:Uncharacterized protein n=1 Tax=candidate division MSBL1 archaeon SCGC-AAA259A05 TaxID=1698259 RepID=A0A133U4Z2_9EURY|nr:hypothetical protein AKJ57_05570 [candidate division MSBL1 archaeon SCGC-AAA259A05]
MPDASRWIDRGGWSAARFPRTVPEVKFARPQTVGRRRGREGASEPRSPRKLAGYDRELPSRKGAERKHPSQSPETIGVESSRSIAPTERCSSERVKLEGKTVIPGSGSPALKAEA